MIKSHYLLKIYPVIIIIVNNNRGVLHNSARYSIINKITSEPMFI